MEESVTGLVLAGGRSTRFGSDKARHPVGGEPMAVRVYRVLNEVIRDVRVGLARRGDPSPVAGVPAVYDDPPGVGPIGGLRAALLAGRAEWVLVAACDLPAVTSADVRRLLAARRDSLEAIVSVDAVGAVHPLFACYRRSVVAAIDARLVRGARSLRGLVTDLRHEGLLFAGGALRNVNRPEDLPGDDLL